MNPSEIMRRPDGNFVSMKTMISHLKLLVPAALLTVFGACEKAAILDDTFQPIADYSKSNEALIPDSATRQRIWDAFATEREQMAQRMELINPSLYKTYQADVKAFDTITTYESFQVAKAQFMSNYADYIRAAMQELGITRKALSERAAAIFGRIPFTMGEYGEITSGSRLLIGSGAETPAERIDNSDIPFPIQRKVEQAIGYTNFHTGPSKVYGSRAAGLMISGGTSIAETGQKFQKPGGYNNLRVDIRAERLIVRAYGCGLGLGGAEASIDVILKPAASASGNRIVRNVAHAWAMIPLVPIPVDDEKNEGDPHMTIASMSSNINDEFEVLWKCYASCGVAGFGGLLSSASFYNPTPVKLTWFN